MKLSTIQKILKDTRQKIDGIEGVSQTVFDSLDDGIDRLEGFAGLDLSRAQDAIASSGSAAKLAEQLSTITTERDALTARVAEYEPLAEQLATAITERDAFSTQVNDLTSRTEQLSTAVTNTRKELAGTKVLFEAGVMPTYENLLLPQVAEKLTLEDDGSVTVPDGLVDSFKTQYSAMFYANNAVGTGGVVGDGKVPDASPDNKTVSVGETGVVSGVDPDAVLKGDVKLTRPEVTT